MTAPSAHLMLLIDGENINQPHLVELAIAQANSTGNVVAGAAVLPGNPGKQMRRVLDTAHIDILPRLPEMPSNAADAMLACVALTESITGRWGITDFVFVTNDLGFGGPAALLRSKGFRSWRICTNQVEGSSAGFDGVVCLAPADPDAAIDLPAELLPAGPAVNLAYWGTQITRSHPELKRRIMSLGKTLAEGLTNCANRYGWPIRLQTTGSTTRIVRC